MVVQAVLPLPLVLVLLVVLLAVIIPAAKVEQVVLAAAQVALAGYGLDIGGDFLKKTLAEWIDLFEQKTNLAIMHKQETISKCTFDDEKGFAVFMLQGDTVHIDKICGDGNYWRDFIEDYAKKNKAIKLKSASVRNIRAVLRAFRFKLSHEKHTEGERIMYCKDKKGRNVEVKYIGKAKNGEDCFELVQYLYGGDN